MGDPEVPAEGRNDYNEFRGRNRKYEETECAQERLTPFQSGLKVECESPRGNGYHIRGGNNGSVFDDF